jgi:uncharacterized repeat protein (TIGR01451 family)
MKRSNLIDSMVCKYPSLLTGLLFITTAVLPLATPAMAGASDPVLQVTGNTTLTGFIPVGSAAIYQVTVKNISANKAYNVKITDALPAGFKYGKELSIMTKGAVVPTGTSSYVKPAENDTNPTWNNYDIPGGGIVTVIFTANASSDTTGPFPKTVSNAVTVDYKNSAGTAQTAIGNNGSGPNVVVKAVPPQPSLGNAVRSSTAQSYTPVTYCGGKPGAEGIATNITGIVNTYFKPTNQSVAAGSTSGISIAAVAAKGKTRQIDNQPIDETTNPAINPAINIKPGDLLLIVQMQDASISGANDDTYGSGSTTYQGSGQSSMGKTGLYEYAVAASDVSSATGGGTLLLTKPLINSYVSSDITKDANGATTAGQKRFQVIRVPQYASVTVQGTLYASPWDGNVGGVLAVDTFGKFNLNNQRMSANSTGFRGGFGLQNAGPNAIADFAKLTSIYAVDASKRVLLNSNGSAQSITTVRTAGSGKGEGTAGTPRFISTQSLGVVDPATGVPTWNGGSLDNIDEGYPGGDTGRGAPANAGGAGNYHNAGGGGGGNGGIGGQGGLSWSNGTTNVNKDTGGRPGYLSSTDNPVPWKIIMGGGGGGGDANNSPQGVPGGAGGGIVMLRAGTLVGSGQIYANGRDGDRGAYSGSPDGAGGAGAGGTVLIQSRNASTANLTIQAKGGNGGSSEQDAFSRYTGSPVTLANQASSGESVGYSADGYGYDNTPHGPGGGGAGGVVLYNIGAGATVNAVATGGIAGHTDDPMPASSTRTAAENAALAAKGGKTSNPHGATAGSNGIVTSFSSSEDPFNSLNNVTDCSPHLTMTNKAVTPTVHQGEIAKFKIRVQNTALIGSAVDVNIDNTLLAGFAYVSTDSVSLDTGTGTATRTNPSTPVTGSTTPAWGKFTIPPGGVVEVTYQVRVKSTVAVGDYDNGAHTSYPDPLRDASTPNAVIENSYDVTSSHDDNVVVIKGTSYERVWNLSPTIRIVRK